MAAASIPYAFVIVGKRDNPIYETEWLRGPKREERSHLNQFIIHAALDEVDELKWKNKNMYLGKVDSFNDIHVSSFVTACNFRLMMLHDGKNEDGVRNFFRDAYELAVKVCTSILCYIVVCFIILYVIISHILLQPVFFYSRCS